MISMGFQYISIDNAILVVTTMAGFSLDNIIAKRVGVRGYGVLMGATVGNAISDGVAGLPEGVEATAGVFFGAIAPIVPIGVAMMAKKELKGTLAGKLVLASCTGMLVLCFVE
eukprot:TRINITY_DN18689_c0_g1_i1.p5 TRINITY_DN18689_c0_g1~~TRINITY_DN18689_c0_g1_i1.p5  ORF type:complete len:113 (+),score=26.33 TRINITY_DN18689_c0_g1_i1:683-1021(+)